MSIGFLLSSPDDAVIWRGPKKNGMYLYCVSMCMCENVLFSFLVIRLFGELDMAEI